MNDPHVVALQYRIEHGPDVIDWSRADPLDKEERSFRVQAENGRVRFDLKEHYASEEAARFAVEADYIRNWEFIVGLARGPNAFTLRFDRSEIEDRKNKASIAMVAGVSDRSLSGSKSVRELTNRGRGDAIWSRQS